MRDPNHEWKGVWANVPDIKIALARNLRFVISYSISRTVCQILTEVTSG